MKNISIGDKVFKPAYGNGIIEKVFDNGEIIHVFFDKRKTVSIIHINNNLKIDKDGVLLLPCDVIGGNVIQGYIERIRYCRKTGAVTSIKKPYYTTKNSKLIFNDFNRRKGLKGIHKASLGIIHVDKNEVYLFVLSNDKDKDKKKTSFWRTIVRRNLQYNQNK